MLEITKYQSSQVELGRIDGDDKRFQCRQVTDGDVKEMAATLKEHGQKFPIVLLRRRDGDRPLDGRLVIICGFTRHLGAKLLGWATIAAIIIPEEDFENEAEIRKFGIIENSKRKQLTDVDKANICKELSTIGVSNVEIGALIGKSEKQVRRYLKVANAPAEQQQKLNNGETSINAISGESLGVHAEPNVDNHNCYVKSTKNGFTAVLKYQYGRDKADIIKDFKAKIDAQYQELQNAKAGKNQATDNRPQTKEVKPDGVSAGGSKESAGEKDLKAQKQKARRELEDAKRSADDPKMLEELKKQGITPERFKAQIDEALKKLGPDIAQ
jgi:ParB/RepB/Spo0J family partition protein